MDAAFADFSKVIGFELKKEQTKAEAIYSVLSGSDVLVVLPTSFDKSMIYQGIALVVCVSWTENFSNSPCNISACCPNEESSTSGADEEERDQCSLHW